MKVYYRTKKLEKLCASEKESIKALGVERARKLRRRLVQLSAAATLAEIERVPPARCHELSQDRAGQLSVDLAHPYRLIFIPANDPVPRRRDGGLDWSAVTSIEIIEIADTHD
jgi:plasmid maintenance system killer protein